MGNKVERSMVVGVSANTADFNAAMKAVMRDIGHSRKATIELATAMRALQEATDKDKLSTEQQAVVLQRITDRMAKYRAEVQKAVTAQNAWAAGLARMRVAADSWNAGMARMAKQNADRRALSDANFAARQGRAATRQSFFDELDVAAGRTNADIQARRDANFAARQGRAATRQSFLDELGAGQASIAQRRADRRDLTMQGGQFMAQFGGTRQQAMAQMREARQMFKQGAIDANQYATAVGKIRDQHSLATKSFQAIKDSILPLVGGLVIAQKSFDFLTDSISKAIELQRNTARLGTFLGSTADATAMLNEIRAFTREAPVSFEASQRAVTTMLQFGVASDQVIPSLKAIAEITGGDQMRMESLALAFAQSQAAGRLMGQELLQMVNAGFNPLMVISQQTGVSLIDLKRRMEDGAISSEMVAKAFQDAVDAGGRFHGLMREMADTTAGSVTKAVSAIDELKIAIGELILISSGEGLKSAVGLLQLATGTHSVYGQQSTNGTGNLLFRSMLGDRRAMASLAVNERGQRDQLAVRQFQSAIGRAGSDLGMISQATVDFSTTFGVSRLNSDMKQRYEDAKRYLAELSKIQQEEMRVNNAFLGGIQGQQDAFLENVYGDKAGIVGMIRGSAGDLTETINDLIDQQAPYEAVVAAASDTARAEVERLEALSAINAEFEAARQHQEELAKQQEAERKRDEETRKTLADKRQYLQDVIALGEKEARIRQGIAEGLTREQATQRENQNILEDMVSQAERIKRDTDNDVTALAKLMAMAQIGMITQTQFEQQRSELFRDSNAAASSVGAPTAVQAGSSEFFSLIANLQVQAVSEQQRLADRAYRVQKATADAAQLTAGILDEIKDELAPGMAP